ncbi:DUF742 domain-containing protein [Nonomuraea sp. NPDC048826]|uniref:DUF742 domain-containing protein n=1 Tax=Nonomuraea sp. NPDC048826 TaxID=3364347 RepID=UPI00370FBE98
MSREHEWVDEEAGPVVRPYAVTRGRTRPAAKALSTGLDLLATVSLTGRPAPAKAELGVQHRRLLSCVARHATPVAEVAGELDLPVAVVRVLIGDLIDYDLVTVKAPRSKAATPTESLLREVISGLRAL